MISKRYTINITNDIRFVESNLIVIKTLRGRFQIKGDNISLTVRDILSYFKDPAYIENVVSTISKKYNEGSLRKLIDYLLEMNILIDEYTNETIQTYDRDFIDKTLYYTLGGSSLQEIVDKITPKRIGIIGTKQIVECLLKDLINGGLLTNFDVGITEEISDIIKIADNSKDKIINYSVITDPDSMKLLVENCDFIIVTSNYRNHYLFKQINKLCIKMSKKWLRIMIDGDVSEVGPLFIPNETCCYSCLNYRENSNKTKEKYIFDSLFEGSKLQNNLEEKSLGLYSIYPINLLTSAIACSEIMKFLTGLTCNLLNQVIRVNGIDFEIQNDTIFKYHLCSDCSESW